MVRYRVDAEGSFPFSIVKRLKYKIGWEVKPEFTISAHNNPANRKLLESFQIFFGGGKIYFESNQLYYRVQDLVTLLKVRGHFQIYKLVSTKRIYFELWNQVLD